MLVDASPRGSGKTTRGVNWVKQGHILGTSRVIIVCTEMERDRIISTYNLSPDEVIVYCNVKQFSEKELWIDNIDEIVFSLFGGCRCISGVSLTSGR